MLTDNFGHSCRIYSFSDQTLQDGGTTNVQSMPAPGSDVLRADLMLDHALHIFLDENNYEEQQRQRIELVQEAVYLYSVGGGSAYEATANRFLGDLLIAAGRQDESLAPLSRACALEELNSRISATSSSLTNLACAYYSLAEAYTMMHQIRQAEQCYARSAHALGKAIAIIDLNRDQLFVVAIETLLAQMEFSEEPTLRSTICGTIQFPTAAKTREYLRIRKAWNTKLAAEKKTRPS